MSGVKTIENISVAYVAKKGNPAVVAGKAFWELEQKVPLRGNKFYGVFDIHANEYRACVELNETNGQLIKNFARGVIPGGLYACVTIKGTYNYIIRQIGSTFDILRAEYEYDSSRPSVEFYRRHTEVEVILPVKQ